MAECPPPHLRRLRMLFGEIEQEFDRIHRCARILRQSEWSALAARLLLRSSCRRRAAAGAAQRRGGPAPLFAFI